MPRRTHLAVVYLRKPKNRNAIIVQYVVIKFSTHVNDMSDTRSNDLIHISFGCNTSANGNAFGYEIERYGHGHMLRRRPLSVDLLEDLGHLSFDKGFPGGDSDGIIGETELLVNTAAFGRTIPR